LGGRTGRCADSKDPFLAGDEYIAWLNKKTRDPRQKLFIASDSLDVDTILRLHAHFSGTIRNGASPTDLRQARDFLDAGTARAAFSTRTFPQTGLGARFIGLNLTMSGNA
jgi:hypothetical protein